MESSTLHEQPDSRAVVTSQPHWWYSSDFIARLGIFSALYLAFSLPIMLAGRPYLDDIGRNLTGSAGWTQVGRPMANLTMEAMNFSLDYITNLSPLPLLLSIIILAAVSAWATIRFQMRLDVGILGFGTLVCNPFFLENLSYQFDCLPMSLGVAFAMLPVLLDRHFASRSFALLSVACIIISLSFYQPSANVYIVMSCFAVVTRLDRATTFRHVIHECSFLLTYLIGAFLYRLMLTFLPLDGYAKSHARALRPEQASDIIKNLLIIYRDISENLLYSTSTIILLALIVLAGISGLLGILRVRTSISTKTTQITFAIAIFSIMLLGIAGPLAILENPVLAPRVFIGFGAVGACALTLLVQTYRGTWLDPVVKIFIVIVLLGQLTMSFAYGNALSAQSAFEEGMARNIVEDIHSIAESTPAVLLISGEGFTALTVKRQQKRYPIIKALVFPIIKEDGYWGGILLRVNGLSDNVVIPDTVHGQSRVDRIAAACQHPRVINRRYYDIFQNGQDIILDFDKQCEGRSPSKINL
ncbi:MAG: glucosyltransferase domain-containing protein [Janthinobacterium lividum]